MSTVPAPPPLAAPVSPMVRLAILDDHEILLDSLSTWIEKNAPEFDLVLRAGSWLELVHSHAFPTDLVIMDLQLRESIFIGACARTCRAAGGQSDRPDRGRHPGGSRGGARRGRDRLCLEISADERPPCRRAVGWEAPGGGSSGAAPVAWRPAPPAPGAVRPRLSDGERQALLLYADGRTTSEVAQAMSVQYETAKTYLRRVREKYGKAGRPTSSRADLIRRAAEDGYLT
ncbi:response regulator transcription factor [Leifsonia xyli]|uniref:response regulator transcription factor n=1 Tax=Leifsonia xyli TaxID=1575 RepID=UPI000A575568|nr:sigma factor-like helix-turn-helix DNA-binding protein [Leifsonia xyli]